MSGAINMVWCDKLSLMRVHSSALMNVGEDTLKLRQIVDIIGAGERIVYWQRTVGQLATEREVEYFLAACVLYLKRKICAIEQNAQSTKSH